MKVKAIKAFEILDSRGTPTIAALIETDDDFKEIGFVPSGASTGSREAIEKRDGGNIFNGKGVTQVIKNAEENLFPELIGMKIGSQVEFDSKLIELDGTKNKKNFGKLISKKTSSNINNILRKVVTDSEGTASLADLHGYSVGGKTGTSQNYSAKDKNLNTFISMFPSQKPKYVLLVMLENPKVAKNLIYNYRGIKIKGTRNEAGWNSVYTAGKIIKKIGPILAINNEEFEDKHVAKKTN